MDCRTCRLDEELASKEKKNSKERRRPDHVPLHKPCPDALAGFAGVVSRCPRLPSVVVYRYKGDGEREGGGVADGRVDVEVNVTNSDVSPIGHRGNHRGRRGLVRALSPTAIIQYFLIDFTST